MNYLNSNFYTSSVYTDYTMEKENHYLKVMLGMNTEEYIVRSLSAQRSDVITSSIPEISASVGADKINNDGNNPTQYKNWATAGFFGRINYTFKDRYLLEANLRYDGSSRFLRDQRWNLFPSFSLGWNMAYEEFFAPLSSVVNTFKPRLSWGMLGNQNTDAFYPFYLTQTVIANGGSWLMGNIRPTTAAVPGLVSSSLTWEKITPMSVSTSDCSTTA